ncbi:MAG: DMT family transporter, partial [Acidobacteria bacterium]|nr:DMT family transporter [Acidobacteriota bacterium]
VLANQPTNRVAVALYLTPVVGVLVSWLIVDEALHWRDLVGGALVLVAVAVSETRGNPFAQRRAMRQINS